MTNRILRAWVAFFAGFLAITLIAKAMGDALPPNAVLEWRAIAFTYTNGKYDHAVDMFDHPFKDHDTCMAAIRDGVTAMHGNLKDGDGVAVVCLQVPVFEKVPTT